jgi:hypothetical protein
MKFEVDIPREFLPWIQQFAKFYGVSTEQAVSTLTIFQAACHRAGTSESCELRTYVLPAGLQLSIERMEESDAH